MFTLILYMVVLGSQVTNPSISSSMTSVQGFESDVLCHQAGKNAQKYLPEYTNQRVRFTCVQMKE